jgi:Ca-activated chloride channel family protein
MVTTVALGSDTGSPVEQQANGAISRRDAAAMRMAADRTGGIYIDGNRDDAAALLSAHLLSLSQETRFAENNRRKIYNLFILLSILAYAAYKFIPLLSVGKKITVLSMLFIIFTFTSCSQGKLLLIEANYLFSRGRYDEAMTPFQKALNYNDSVPYAEYGLGLTLFLLDNGMTALTHYANSQKTLESFSENEHRELRYRNFYNSGIIYFELGDYLSAANAFKEALRIDPRRIDAKQNLEISLMSITRKTTSSNRETRSEPMEIFTEYFRQQEEQIWRSTEWIPEEDFTGPDY